MIDVRKEYKWIKNWINDDLDNLGTDIDTRVFKAEEVAMMMQIYSSEVVKNNVVLDSVIVPFVCHNCQSKEGKELTRSTTQCKKCAHLQAN